jgi:hypothetical protein
MSHFLLQHASELVVRPPNPNSGQGRGRPRCNVRGLARGIVGGIDHSPAIGAKSLKTGVCPTTQRTAGREPSVSVRSCLYPAKTQRIAGHG